MIMKGNLLIDQSPLVIVEHTARTRRWWSVWQGCHHSSRRCLDGRKGRRYRKSFALLHFVYTLMIDSRLIVLFCLKIDSPMWSEDLYISSHLYKAVKPDVDVDSGDVPNLQGWWLIT